MLEIEINYMIENYKHKHIEEIADDLGVCESTILYHARKLELPRKNKMSDDEIQFLKDNYPECGAKRLAKMMGRSYENINRVLKEMGMKK